MPDKGGDFGSKAVATLAGAAAAFVARKTIIFAWTKATGKEPPSDTDSPEVSMGEAIGYAVVMGVGMSVAQIVVNRTAKKRYDAWKALKQATPEH